MIRKGDVKQPGPVVRIELKFGEPIPKDPQPPDPKKRFYGGAIGEYGVTQRARTGRGVTVMLRDAKPLHSQNKISHVYNGIAFHVGDSAKVSPPPGSLLRSVADFLCSIGTMTNVVEPAIADMQFEIFEALNANRPQKARWALIRGYWGVIVAIGLVQTLRRVRQILKF